MKRKRTDTAALDILTEILRRPEWPSGADFLEWCAEIVASTGRDIVNGPHDPDCDCGKCFALEEIDELEGDIEQLEGLLAETNDVDEVRWMAEDLGEYKARLAVLQKEVEA